MFRERLTLLRKEDKSHFEAREQQRSLFYAQFGNPAERDEAYTRTPFAIDLFHLFRCKIIAKCQCLDEKIYCGKSNRYHLRLRFD